MIRRIGTWGALAGLIALALISTPAMAAPFASGEFQVSGLEENNKLIEGPDGNIWVTLHGGTNDVARIDPKTGAVEEFDLPEVREPQGIAAAGEFLWVTQDLGIAKFDPRRPTTTTVATTIGLIDQFHSIVTGPDGNLWVATVGAVVRIPPDNLNLLKPVSVAGLQPRDIDVAGQTLVVADANATRHRFLTATTDGTIAEHEARGGVKGIAGSPSGEIAFSQAGLVPPELGLFTSPGPPVYAHAPGVDPIGVTLGPDGAFWAAEAFGTESVTRFGSGISPTALVPGFAGGSRPRQIAAGPENTLWVTLEGGGSVPSKVGRISGVVKPPATSGPNPPATEPETKLGAVKGTIRTKGRFARIKFSFSSTSAGAGFECRLARLTGGKPSKAPSFMACQSPKAYRLGPGRYSFEVRAVLGGVADKSPATRSFRVVRVLPRGHRSHH